MFVRLALPEMHSRSVRQFNSLQSSNQQHHVFQVHAVQTPYVGNKTVPVHVCAYQIILEILMKDVVLNVCLIRIAHQIELVSIINVKIHVLELVVKIQIVR